MGFVNFEVPVGLRVMQSLSISSSYRYRRCNSDSFTQMRPSLVLRSGVVDLQAVLDVVVVDVDVDVDGMISRAAGVE